MNRPELIMVMGVQRSGTNALFDSLATDQTLSSFPESIDSFFYSNFLLRPVSATAPLLQRIGGRILLKPISETVRRSVQEVAEEYREYRLRIVWIYRDPVNVLDSMQRQKWISAEEIGTTPHHLGWRKRNESALAFHKQHPEQIAIVRYEDLCCDSRVFRRLTRWLGLKCKSYFRTDSAQGRECIRSGVQDLIDAATAVTLEELHAARRFKAGLRHRWRSRLAHRLARANKKHCEVRAPALAKESSAFSHSGEPARAPSSVAGLHFWLQPAVIFQRNGPVETEISECGPHRMIAAPAEHGPYAFLSLNRKAVLYYPHSKVSERRAQTAGSLVFRGKNWLFLLTGAAFTIITLFRPNVPCYPPYHQQRSSIFRVGRRREAGPEFSLRWSGESNSASAVFSSGAEMARAATPPQSHPRQEWRVVVVQNSGGDTGELSISANDRAGPPARTRAPPRPPIEDDYVLELGGSEPESLFYGEVAEVIIFHRALEDEERSGVVRYLRETYRL